MGRDISAWKLMLIFYALLGGIIWLMMPSKQQIEADRRSGPESCVSTTDRLWAKKESGRALDKYDMWDLDNCGKRTR